MKRVHLGMKPSRDALVISESGLYSLVMRCALAWGATICANVPLVGLLAQCL